MHRLSENPAGGSPGRTSIERDTGMSIVRELLAFMVENKKLWMLPVIAIMLLIGGLMFLAKGSALAPLIYTIF